MVETIPRITPDELKQRLDRGEQITIVDSRAGSWDRSSEMIPGAIRIPANSEEQHVGSIPRGRMVVTYCT